MSNNIPNTFIQAKVQAKEKGKPHEKIIMKIASRLVDILVLIAPEIYAKHMVYKNGKKVLYVKVLRALYGMLISAMLWYSKFCSNLEGIIFELNPYNPCIANQIVNGKQQTIQFHVDDLLSSHIDPRVNDKFLAWLKKTYGKHGKVKSTRRKVHNFLGIIDFSTKGKMIINKHKYMKKLYDNFEEKYVLNGTRMTPAAEDLFSNDAGSPRLDKKMRKDFHHFTAQRLFAA